ncbi:unnamed protein product, partial [Ectocarpus sp. 8 AP-2014]
PTPPARGLASTPPKLYSPKGGSGDDAAARTPYAAPASATAAAAAVLIPPGTICASLSSLLSHLMTCWFEASRRALSSRRPSDAASSRCRLSLLASAALSSA